MVAEYLRMLLVRMIYLIVSVSLFIGCEKDKSPFGNEPEQFYSSHEFEWSADTLVPPDAYQVHLTDIWGTDEDNVWAVGHSDRNKYQIWHWDGRNWQNVQTNIIGDRPSYSEIFGFSENDFWIVGSAGYHGYVLRYDHGWERVDNNDLEHCYSVWGTSSQNMFIGSRHGLIYKYDGEHFVRYETGRNILITTIWGLHSGEIFAIGVNNENQPTEPPIRYLFKYSTNHFVLIDSLVRTSPGDETIGMDLWGTDLNNLYSPTGNSLTKYVNGKWVTQFYAPLFRIFGNSSNNIFAGGFGSALYHYNGIDWKPLNFNEPINESIWGIWCNDEHVFVIQDFNWGVKIFRGKKGIKGDDAYVGN